MSLAKSSAAARSNGAQPVVEQAASSGSRQGPRKPGGRFVAYLPHDDAVAAGFRKSEGGIDVSSSQEVTDLLNAELSALLRLRPHQFWKHAITDESLQKYLESYLRFRRRWFDLTPVQNGEAPSGIVVGDNDLYCRTFKVLYRMSSFHESRAVSVEISEVKEEPARLLFEKGLLDVPKLMDICAIYGHDNPDLTRRLVSNVLSSIPNVADEISAIIPPLVHTVDILHRRCQNVVQECTQPDSSTGAVDVGNHRKQLVEVLDYLNDVVATIIAFINAYPMAASILATFAAPSNVQGPFLPFLAGIYDSLLPLLRNGLVATYNYVSSSNQHRESKHFTELRFKRLRVHLVSLAWEILRISYLGNLGMGSSSSSNADDKERPRGVQGDFVIQAVVSLAIGVDDKENFSFGSANGLLKLNCTGGMLKTIEKKYGLCEQIRQLCHSGEIILDDAQYEYLAALAVDQDTDLLNMSDSLALRKPAGENLRDEDEGPLSAVTQSKVQEIRDIFPAFGTGFILACLEVYDSDPEKVIQNILEGSLYPDLACLETWLEKKPTKSISGLSGKDKGKKIVLEEQPLLPKKTAVAVGAASSSSQVFPAKRAATLPVKDPAVETLFTESVQPISSETLKGPSNGIETRVNQAEVVHMDSTGTQLEYDDEYDDSFDDLVTYPGDTGLEETGNLDEIIAHSAGFDVGSSAARRRQEDPAVGPSWSRKDGSGDRRKSKSGTRDGIPSTPDNKTAVDRRSRPGVEVDSLGESVGDVQMPLPTIRGNAQNKVSAGRGHQIGTRRMQPSKQQYKVKEAVPKHGVNAVVTLAVDDPSVHSRKPDGNDSLPSNIGESSGGDEGVPREGNLGSEKGIGGGYRRRREDIKKPAAS